MSTIRNRYLGFREAYDAYATRVTKPVTEGAARRWLNNGNVPGIKRGNKWTLQVSELIRYHTNVIGTGKKGKKGKSRSPRIKAVSELELDVSAWAPHVQKFLEERKRVRPRQVLDLVGVPQDKLTPEVQHQINQAKDLLRHLGWEQMPLPHSFDWAPLAVVRKAKAKKPAKSRSPKEVEKQTRAFMRWLKGGGMYTLPEIREHFKLSVSQAKSLVYPLVDDGKIAVLGQVSQTMYYYP